MLRCFSMGEVQKGRAGWKNGIVGCRRWSRRWEEVPSQRPEGFCSNMYDLRSKQIDVQAVGPHTHP